MTPFFPPLEVGKIVSTPITIQPKKIRSKWTVHTAREFNFFHTFGEKKKMNIEYTIHSPVMFTMTRGDLSTHFDARAKNYQAKVAVYMDRLETMERMKTDENREEDEMTREVMSYSNRTQLTAPIDQMRERLRTYRNKVKWYSFAATHLSAGPFDITMEDIRVLELDQ